MKRSKNPVPTPEGEDKPGRPTRRQALALGGAAAAAAGIISLLILLIPSSVAADNGPVYVDLWDCPGTEVVPPGVDLIIRTGWGAENRGLARAFLTAADVSVSVDGEPIPNANQFWGPIFEGDDLDGDGDSEFGTLWAFTMDPLAIGESYVIDWVLDFTHIITDGLDVTQPDGRPDLFGPGTTFTEACTVTAS